MAPSPAGRTSPQQIANRIVDAILAGRIAPGQRLVEQSLADVFGVSRTLIREAMARLSARGMVEVNARRGWFVVQPSRAEADRGLRGAHARRNRHAQRARRAPGEGAAGAPQAARQGRAGGDRAVTTPSQRSYLLGDFHVCMAECLGGALLADILRDLTARTTLISTLFQSHQDAAQSCAEHAQIVAALESGDRAQAIALLRQHIQAVANSLGAPSTQDDPLVRCAARWRHKRPPLSLRRRASACSPTSFPPTAHAPPTRAARRPPRARPHAARAPIDLERRMPTDTHPSKEPAMQRRVLTLLTACAAVVSALLPLGAQAQAALDTSWRRS